MLVVTTTATAGLTFAYASRKLAQVIRQPCPGCGHEVGPADSITILFVGSDTRTDIPKSETGQFCARPDCSDLVGPAHSDAIMVLRIFPSVHKVSLLSIPRDLNVAIAQTGQRDRINAAFGAGPERLVETIRNNLGIPIDHFIDADFVGFSSMVGVVGGLNVYFPTPTRDLMSDLSVPAGCVRLDSKSALAYVRSRHTEFFENGQWISDPLSDLSRVKRQQDFMRRLISKIKTIRNPLTAKRVLDSSVHYFKLDDRFSIWDALRVLRAARGIAPDSIQGTTLPVENIDVGGAAELQLQQPEASTVIDSFLRGPAAAPAANGAAAAPRAAGPSSEQPAAPAAPKC